MAAVSTGNHGASLAAYCGLAGLPAIALLSTQSDVIHRAMVSAFGGTAVVSDRREQLLHHLVKRCGWFPVTDLTMPEAANPYGVEAYKTIAYEIFEDLGRPPDAVLVPTASGDLSYGVYKGFRELVTLGFASRCPRLLACQAEGAAPLAAAVRAGLEEVPVLSSPTTVAVSIGDATSGKHALEAVRASRGDVITVGDDEIIQAQRDLAGRGLFVEPASASTLAALRRAAKSGAVLEGERIVALLTGAAVKWSTQATSLAMTPVVLEPSEAGITDLAVRLAPRTAITRG
jgi:threonine synthase